MLLGLFRLHRVLQHGLGSLSGAQGKSPNLHFSQLARIGYLAGCRILVFLLSRFNPELFNHKLFNHEFFNKRGFLQVDFQKYETTMTTAVLLENFDCIYHNVRYTSMSWLEAQTSF